MSSEPRTCWPAESACLQHCLVEGNTEQRLRERRIRRRALAISIVLQSAALAALLLTPLFGKHQRIAWASTPIPPYYHPGGPARPVTVHTAATRAVCRICKLPASPPAITFRPGPVDGTPSMPFDGPGALSPGSPGELPFGGPRTPQRPIEPQVENTRVLRMTRLDPAMLIERIEPIYPPLAKQTGRSGRVELRAVIATDGTIESLQVVSGDVLFCQSALAAVRQWRYRPTVLNGQPVEIDTYITITYSLQR